MPVDWQCHTPPLTVSSSLSGLRNGSIGPLRGSTLADSLPRGESRASGVDSASPAGSLGQSNPPGSMFQSSRVRWSISRGRWCLQPLPGSPRTLSRGPSWTVPGDPSGTGTGLTRPLLPGRDSGSPRARLRVCRSTVERAQGEGPRTTGSPPEPSPLLPDTRWGGRDWLASPLSPLSPLPGWSPYGSTRNPDKSTWKRGKRGLAGNVLGESGKGFVFYRATPERRGVNWVSNANWRPGGRAKNSIGQFHLSKRQYFVAESQSIP